MELFGLVTLVACASAAVPATVPTPTPVTKCERAPAHASPSDEHYRISVSGEPDLFLPGELYTVSLQGIDSGQGPTPFIGFTIWVEVKSDQPKIDKATNQSNETKAANLTLGTFQAYDAQAKIVEVCSPSVDNATAHPKTEVQVIWNAPSGMGVSTPEMCVRVCARVGPYPGVGAAGGGWSVLARELCSAPAAPHYLAKLPPIIEPCCACDEAKYEVTFECLWSRNTHPREFPPESAHAHFGDVIGASHTAQFRVWQEGRVASPGVRRLADDGTTVALEKELKAESDHIRTIIKARGISWQQVGGAGIPNTFAVFRVDAKHHLMSLAAKLAPSPDWIVGVSALELCNANCTWSRSATIPLYPYDAGTDNGVTYTSHRNPTIPATPVRALRPDWPRDARSPFYSTNGEMRPFARLRLTRLRLYEKSCDGSEGEQDRVPEHHVGQGTAASGGACAVHAWGQWGPCSVSCGPGRATRQRDYIWPTRAYAEACRVPLTDYRRCHGPRMHCRAPSEYEPDPAESTGPCAVSNWSEWSPCEGCGVRARVRHYVAPRAYKRCHIGYRARTIMSQAMPCEMGPCQKPPPKSNISAFDWFFVDTPRGDCHVSPWGSWSPCSAKCGRGRRLRTRLYVVHNSTVQAAMTRHLFEIWSKRFMELQSLPYTPHDNTTGEDPEIENKVQEFIDRCQFTLTQQEALCDGDDISCLNNTVPLEVCKQPLSVGHCRGYEERWFYEWAKKTCEPFGFSGCGGNGNNFRTRDHCLRACVTRVNITEVNVTTVANESMTTMKKLKPTPPHENNEVLQNDGPPLYVEAVTCETGPWLGWSECIGDCDFAIKLNYRLVVRPGRGCRRLMKSRACRPTHCQKVISNNSVESADNLNYDDD
ncbi:spondin-1-like isoform X2 [Spodoptera litura]|uniref:Spondin-1 n=1 Tax=Spodoptera litura TaxID=69820 RepID=A0A9J7EL23_SPOLT|nr:spondin-1-like isoform X2 [Spodoptera litura]